MNKWLTAMTIALLAGGTALFSRPNPHDDVENAYLCGFIAAQDREVKRLTNGTPTEPSACKSYRVRVVARIEPDDLFSDIYDDRRD